MLERFTEKALKAITLAQEEARRLCRNFVGTEFILVGLIGEGTGIAAMCLKEAGLTVKDAQETVEKMVGRGSDKVGKNIPLMPGVKRLLQLAWEEAKQLYGDPTNSEKLIPIGTQHLLLALTKIEEGQAKELFNRLHINTVRLREKVIQSIEKNPTRDETVSFPVGWRIDYDPSKSIFAKFTNKAIKVIELAQGESRLMGHNYVGPEQILLGLIAENTGIAAKVLKKMGIGLHGARAEVEKIIGRGSNFVSEDTPFTMAGKNIIDMSFAESDRLATGYVSTEHLLLALMQQKESVAVRVLGKFGYDRSMLDEYIAKFIKFIRDIQAEKGRQR